MKKESKQHFLLSAKARTLSVYEIMQITQEQTFLLFKEMRWGKNNRYALIVIQIITISYVDVSNSGASAVIARSA